MNRVGLATRSERILRLALVSGRGLARLGGWGVGLGRRGGGGWAGGRGRVGVGGEGVARWPGRQTDRQSGGLELWIAWTVWTYQTLGLTQAKHSK